jgi:hypothetical protein
MVESPAQSGRLKTLIHPGPVSGVHVTTSVEKLLENQHLEEDQRINPFAPCIALTPLGIPLFEQ